MKKAKAKVKTKKKTTTLKIKALTNKIKELENCIKHSDEDINKVRLKLKAHIDRRTSQIRVFEESDLDKGITDSGWNGYTGVFYIDPEDSEKMVRNKALNHYERYFKGNEFYKNRTLGLFTTNSKGRKLVKVLQDDKNKLKHK